MNAPRLLRFATIILSIWTPNQLSVAYGQSITPAMAYGFEEGSGTVTADSSGNSHTAKLVNGPSWTSGKFGNALSFNGTGAYVDTAFSTSFSTLTFSAWVNIPSGVSGYPRIFAKFQETYLQFSPSKNSLQFEHMWSGREAYWNTAVNSVTTGVWHNVAVSYDASSSTNVPVIYIDGVVQSLTVGGAPSGTPIFSANNYLVGTQNSSGGFFKGIIDNVRFYNQILSQSQIQTDMITAIFPPGQSDTTPPSVPTNLKTTSVSATTISLAWTASTDPDSPVSGYDVFRNNVLIGSAQGTTYLDANLTPSTSYGYSVAAFDPPGNVSAQSTPLTVMTLSLPDTTPPTVPSNVTASSPSPTSITLAWSASTDPDSAVAGYQVFRNSVQIATLAGTTFTDTNLTPNTTYGYSVAAFDPTGNLSAPSAMISALTQPDTLPPTISIVSPASGSAVFGSVAISATAADNVAVATVQFFVDGTSIGPPSTTLPYSIIWDTTLASIGLHTITAAATDTSGNTGLSAPVTLTVTSFVPTISYGFDEGAGTIAGDSSGNNHQGTLVNTPVWVSGKYGGALSFNGSGAYVDTGFNTSFSTLTFSAWVNIPSGVSGYPRIFAKFQETYLQFSPSKNSLQFEHMWSGREAYWNTAVNSVTTGVWHNVAVSYDASSSTNVPVIYIDGVVQSLTVGGAPSGTPIFSANNYLVGTQNSSGGFFKGIIDNVRFYNQVVPQAKIQSDMNSALAPLPGDTTPPVVTMTNPVSGWTVSDTITLSATATDNVAVASVRFSVDGTNIGSTLFSAPYNVALDTTTLIDGTHTITAVAADTSNNAASTTVSVIVNNTNRPNIVLILDDDQRWDQMSYLPLTSAALANDTVQFDNAFVTTPDCCPSRASILTGLYAHNHGVLQDYLPSGGATVFNPASTIATWLQSSGYRTGLYGKYLNAYRPGAAVPPGWSEFHGIAGNNVGSDDNLYYNYYVNDDGIVNFHGTAVSDYSTTVFGTGAVNFINSTPLGTPLYLEFTPFGPHAPATPDNQDIGSFAGVTPYRPPSFNEADVSDKPLWVQNLPLMNATAIAQNDQLHENQLETLQSVDRAAANIITALQQTGRWNNTILVFMSDNGLSLGEHRMVDAKFTVYEESVRVPFWVRVPGIQPRHEANIVANIDLAPTFAQYAGLTPPAKVNGVSFVNLINNPQSPWRTNILLEYIAPTIAANQDFQAVRTANYVYSELSSGERELYDLQADPYELNNVYSDPAYASIIPGLQAQLANLKTQ